MNKKLAIASIVLIALMSLSLIPASKAWVQNPTGTDDKRFAEYGPQATTLLIKIYPDYSSEFTAFESGNQFDVMDWPLLPTDFNTLRSADPTNTTFQEQYFNEFGLFEYDLNDLAVPTSIPAFRVGLSWAINKDFFINYFSGLAGSATKADSPIASCTGYFASGLLPTYETGAIRTTLGDATPGSAGPNDYQDMLNAYESLVQALGLPVLDPTAGDGYAYGNYWWTWTSPAIMQSPSQADNIEVVPNGYLLVFARSSSPPRAAQGTYMKEVLERALPDWINTNKAALQALPAPYTLPAGCNGAHVYVDLHVTSRTICFDQAMSAYAPFQYRYHVYTGGWSLSRDPDFLQYYTIQYSASKVGRSAHNYGGFEDPNYDPMVVGHPGYPNTGLLVTANPGGDPFFHKVGPGGFTVGNATYWAYSAQEEMMQPSECALIPVWYATGYMAELSALSSSVNQIGLGVDSWGTFLNGYNTKAGTAGYWEPTGQISWGFQSDWSTGNPITATWVWDWNVLGEIYDSLISVNPYNMGNDRPYIADNWTFGTWNAPAGGDVETSAGTCTTINFHLREDVFWQDVPFTDRSAYTWNMSSQINGPFKSYPLTPVDVAFTIMYLRDLDLYDTTDNGVLVDGVVDHVVLNPIWESEWNTALGPGGIPVWFNTTAIQNTFGAVFPDGSTPLSWTRPDGIANVQFSSSVDPESIQVALTGAMGWIGLHRVGGLPLMPFHIWSQIPQDSWPYNGVTLAGAGWLDASPSGANILYGTGPYILVNHDPTVSFTMIAYKAGAAYGGITSEESYFWYSPVMTQSLSPSSATNIVGGANGGDFEYSYWKQLTSGASSSGILFYSPGVLVNKDPINSETVAVTGYYDYTVWNGAAWVRTASEPGPLNATNTVTVTIPAGGYATPWVQSPVLHFTGVSYIDIFDGYQIVVTSGPNAGRTSYGGDFYGALSLKEMYSDAETLYANFNPYPRTTEIINVNHLQGDIGGGALEEPYFGVDHKISISDVGPIAANWGKPVSWVPGTYNPIDTLHKASITMGARIGIGDVGPIAAHWGQTWTENPPADPASPTLP